MSHYSGSRSLASRIERGEVHRAGWPRRGASSACLAAGVLIATAGFAADARLSISPLDGRAAFDNVGCAGPGVGNQCVILTCVNCEGAIPDLGEITRSLTITQNDLTGIGFSSCTVHRTNVAVELTHQHVGDLLLDVQRGATGVFLYDPLISCAATSVDAVFADQQAPGGVNACPATGGSRYQPDEPLSAFAGMSLVGTWTFGVQDTASEDTGMLSKLRHAFDVTCVPLQQTSCTPGPSTLCLGAGNRFKVEAAWRTPQGNTGTGTVVELTQDTGYMWFFNQENVEMVVKVLNGCGINNRYWVFAGGLTNVEVSLTVTDTQHGNVKTYFNPQGAPFQPIQDTSAFATCP